MRKKRFLSWMLFCAMVLPTQNINADMGITTNQDPLININYRNAFDQSKIQKKFKDVMNASGCAANIFSQNDIKQQKKINRHRYQTLQKAYVRACLKQLRSARRWTITEPARESITLLGLLASASLLTTKMLPRDSMGGSFSIFAAVFNSVFLLRDTIRSGYNLAFQPEHPLNSLEKLFAKNQCFIPKALWPAIIEKFMLARQNQFEQRKSMDFIEFTLGLTSYKPKRELELNKTDAQVVINELHARIDQFFNDYNNTSNEKCCQLLKVNISKFVLDLFSNSQTSRYIYLCGPGGIGKTYFI